MSKSDIRPEFEWQNRISNAKMRYSAQIECQNRILNGKMLYSAQIQMANRISKVEMRYSVRIRKSKWNFEGLNSGFCPNLNVKIGLRMSKCDIQPEFECQKGFRMSKCVIPPDFECQNSISNVKIGYSAPVRMSKHDFES